MFHEMDFEDELVSPTASQEPRAGAQPVGRQHFFSHLLRPRAVSVLQSHEMMRLRQLEQPKHERHHRHWDSSSPLSRQPFSRASTSAVHTRRLEGTKTVWVQSCKS